MTVMNRIMTLLMILCSHAFAEGLPFRASWIQEADSDSTAPARVAEVRKAFLAQFSGLLTSSSIANLDKYNQSKVIKAKLTPAAIENLISADKKLKGPPRFVADLLEMKPSIHREILAKRPELMLMTPDEQYLVMPNPRHLDYVSLLSDPKSAKHQKGGIGIVVWYIHPALLQNSRFLRREAVLSEIQERGESLQYGRLGSKDKVESLLHIGCFSELTDRDVKGTTVADIVAESGIPYLSGPFDFFPRHLESLQSLRRTTLAHLREAYGVDDTDRVEMYFHTHHNPDTTTLHMHVRVNQVHHGLEIDKAVSLDEVIQTLASGRSVKEDFLQREYIHAKLDFYDMLEQLGYQLEVVDNPYKIEWIGPSVESAPTAQSFGGTETELKYLIANLESVPADLRAVMESSSPDHRVEKRGYVLQEYIPVTEKNLEAFVYAMNQVGVSFGSTAQQAEFFQEPLSFVKEIRLMTKRLLQPDGSVQISRQATIKSDGGVTRKHLQSPSDLLPEQAEKLAQMFDRFKPLVAARLLKIHHHVRVPVNDGEFVPMDLDLLIERDGQGVHPILVIGEMDVPGDNRAELQLNAQLLQKRAQSIPFLARAITEVSELKSHSVALSGVPAEFRAELVKYRDFNTRFAQNVVTAWQAAGLSPEISRQDIPTEGFKKYNVPEVLAHRFQEREAFERVRERYHQLPVCDIVAQLLLLTDPYLQPIKHRIPEWSRWTKDRRFVVLVNPKYIPKDPAEHELPKAFREKRFGLALVGWFIHPSLFEPSVFSEAGLQADSKERISSHTMAELNKMSPYLTTVLDITSYDLESLRELRSLSLELLRDVFAVDTQLDTVEMYFHFPYPVSTATLHLHVRVNQAHHPMEMSRSVQLDEIIEALENGRGVQDVILDRQRNSPQRAFVGVAVAQELLEGIEGLELELIPNPYRLPEQ